MVARCARAGGAARGGVAPAAAVSRCAAIACGRACGPAAPAARDRGRARLPSRHRPHRNAHLARPRDRARRQFGEHGRKRSRAAARRGVARRQIARREARAAGGARSGCADSRSGRGDRPLRAGLPRSLPRERRLLEAGRGGGEARERAACGGGSGRPRRGGWAALLGTEPSGKPGVCGGAAAAHAGRHGTPPQPGRPRCRIAWKQRGRGGRTHGGACRHPRTEADRPRAGDARPGAEIAAGTVAQNSAACRHGRSVCDRKRRHRHRRGARPDRGGIVDRGSGHAVADQCDRARERRAGHGVALAARGRRARASRRAEGAGARLHGGRCRGAD